MLPRFVSRSGRETAEDATQIFGGRGITMGGMGRIIENVRHLHLLLLSTSLLLTSTAVPPDFAIRRYPCWRRGRARRSRCAPGHAENAEEC